MAIKPAPPKICSLCLTWWNSCCSLPPLLCQPVTDWLHAPDHTGVVWGLYTCSWRSLNISIPNLQKAHLKLHICGHSKRVCARAILTTTPSLKTCFSLFLFSPCLFTICPLHLKAIRLTVVSTCLQWTLLPVLLYIHWLLMNPSVSAIAQQQQIVLHLNVLSFSSTLHHKTQ